MQTQSKEIPYGLKLTFIFVMLEGLFLGLTSMLVPQLVASYSGLPGKDLPVYQQVGASAVGYSILVFLCARAKAWAEVRIPVIAVLFVEIITSAGSFYYVVLQGVMTPYLILILVLSVCFAVALGYYLYKSTKA